MDSFVRELVLAYFKKSGSQYSLVDLSEILGISMMKVEETIQELLQQEYLKYRNHLLELTFSGRIILQNTPSDYLGFFDDQLTFPKNVDPQSIWPLDKVYVPKNFLSKVES